MISLRRLLPTWLQHYPRQHLSDDLIAGVVVGILVIPQSLGYALLAGLPPVYGLYAAIIPVLVYAWIGASATQAIGPVAITSIMTAQALGSLATQAPELLENLALYASFAALLGLMTGLILVLAGWLRLGWLTQFMSRGVVSGFISGAALLIILSQLKHLFGIPLQGDRLPNLVSSFWQHATELHGLTALLGSMAIVLLLLNRRYLNPLLLRRGFSTTTAALLTKLVPVLVVIIATLCTAYWGLAGHGVAIVGDIPSGLPQLSLPALPSLSIGLQLLPAAGLIALIAFISSASVAQEFALKRHEIFDANRELSGLGYANVAGAFSQGFPVTGGFSRTAVNVEAGAQTPLAGVGSALVMLLVLLLLSSWFYHLPLAVLGAGIIVAVWSLIDVQTLKLAWQSDRMDAWVWLATAAGVVMLGLQVGLMLGLMLSFMGLLWQSSHPHLAVVGQIADTGHFRNIERYSTVTYPEILLLRIDESLYFGNCRAVAHRVEAICQQQPKTQHVVLILSAVNHIDLAAQQMLQTLNRQLQTRAIKLHLAEVKGPVYDALQRSPLLLHLSGQVFLTPLAAVQSLRAQQPPEYYL
ncbi:MAG: sulfate permease [Pseudomonadota bacterium]|nr:sulfate permease [Pseudomonadota bacterium]